MNKSLLIFVSACCISMFAYSQAWKENKPYADYWQQDVYYKIKATIDDQKDQIISTDYELTYTNNSPDTLNELYFHLFSNAFQPGSYYHKLWQGNDKEPRFGEKYEAKGLGTEVENIKVDGKDVRTQLDNTILKVVLSEPLLPNSKVKITLDFVTYYDSGDMRRRMKSFTDKWGNKHYDGVHWYPSIAAYDRKFGWTTDQHLDKEFYHDFGTFEVELTFPEEYIVEATGVLQNFEEVYPDSLRQKIDLRNFKDKPWDSEPSVIIPRDSANPIPKTWKFKAENVHNFAFTADPTYRIHEVEWNGIKCVAVAQEPHASKWQRSADFLAEVIQTYSEDFGMYSWPKIIISDARDGMEYPMLTLDGGSFPGHKGLIAHEVGHMWFYGQVGSNETYRANMDEGFTQFLTVWFLDKHTRQPENKALVESIGMSANRMFRLYYPYFSTVWSGYDHQLNTHAAAYNGGLRHGGGYGLVYYKQGVMLYNLKYVLGDDLFQAAMKNYFATWKFKHPYPEDFRTSIIRFTHVDLNWFFDQWLETTKFIDYGIKKVKKSSEGYDLTFERKGRMQMPVDFKVIYTDGSSEDFIIPNTWFVKKTDATVLPKWYGWDLLQPEYTATIKTSKEIRNVVIDTSHLMADIDMRNNSWKTDREFKLDLGKPGLGKWHKVQHTWRPALSYNSFDGAQVGLKYSKSYFDRDDFLNVSVHFNTGIAQNGINDAVKKEYIPFAFRYSINRDLKKWARGLRYYESMVFDEGLFRFKLGFSKVIRKQDNRNPNFFRISVYSKHMITSFKAAHNNYFFNDLTWSNAAARNSEGLWNPNQVNASANVEFEQYYSYKKGNGNYKVHLRIPGVLSSYNYSFINVESINNIRVQKDLQLKSRVFAQAGSAGMPLESSLYFAGANQENMMDIQNKELLEMVPTDWFQYQNTPNTLHVGGGLNLRGYAGYYLPEEVDGEVEYTAYGNSGISWNTELEFEKIFGFIKARKLKKRFDLKTYLFNDMGVIQSRTTVQNKPFLSYMRWDAGLGSALTIKFPKRTYKPITIRFDMPLFLNSPSAVEPNYFGFRYIVGLGRAF